MARTQRITAELRQCAGINYQGSIPQNARTGAVITVESFVGAGARWTYWSQDVLPSLPLGAILYWLADHLAGAERRTLQADPEAAQLAAQWQSGTVEMFFHPAVPAAAQLQTQPQTPPVSRPARPAPTCARTKSWQSMESEATLLGEISRGQYAYIGPVGAQVREGDTLTLGDKTYLFRRAELYYYRNQPVYQWGLCVEKGVNDTWASQS